MLQGNGLQPCRSPLAPLLQCRRGGIADCLKGVLRQKLVHHDNCKYEGYRLTTLGYDFLALKALLNRGAVSAVGQQIGVGKESDVFEVLVATTLSSAPLGPYKDWQYSAKIRRAYDLPCGLLDVNLHSSGGVLKAEPLQGTGCEG